MAMTIGGLHQPVHLLNKGWLHWQALLAGISCPL
jgi:hypothetical protein